MTIMVVPVGGVPYPAEARRGERGDCRGDFRAGRGHYDIRRREHMMGCVGDRLHCIRKRVSLWQFAAPAAHMREEHVPYTHPPLVSRSCIDQCRISLFCVIRSSSVVYVNVFSIALVESPPPFEQHSSTLVNTAVLRSYIIIGSCLRDGRWRER